MFIKYLLNAVMCQSVFWIYDCQREQVHHLILYEVISETILFSLIFQKIMEPKNLRLDLNTAFNKGQIIYAIETLV